jgi:hypothetical protein
MPKTRRALTAKASNGTQDSPSGVRPSDVTTFTPLDCKANLPINTDGPSANLGTPITGVPGSGSSTFESEPAGDARAYQRTHGRRHL